jgi:hypothetical protein
MTICKITVFALVRELQALQRVDWEQDQFGTVEVDDEHGDYIRYEDLRAVLNRNVIPEAP